VWTAPEGITSASSGNLPGTVLLGVQEVAFPQGSPAVEITLYQAMPKGDKLETIIQRLWNWEHCRIVPVLTRRCVSRPDEKSMHRKLERYNKISLEAAKQCGRGCVPEVGELTEFRSAVGRMKNDRWRSFFMRTRTDRCGMRSRAPADRMSILVGSEGGFEPQEAQYAAENWLIPASLAAGSCARNRAACRARRNFISCRGYLTPGRDNICKLRIKI
jgi:16S rRNA (uracil1498-N3)-methyltransferase